MCGFVGSHPTQDRPSIEKAIKQIRHRGPDEQAVRVTHQGVLGHARLSIVDVTGSHQPMQDEQRWIVFNGEIYNFEALRARLPGQWSTHGDTEVVLRMFDVHRQETVDMLDGMFAFAILNGGLFLARDPLGIKPLYYAKTDQNIHFASEIKALLHAPGAINEFPAGHWWDAEHGFVRYFHIDDLQWNAALPKDLPLAQIEERLRATLRRAVQKRLIADPGIPVGISLSGGLDSSLIAALAREGRATLDTFVVGMDGSEDITASQQVANALGTNHHVYVYTFAEMLEALPEVIYHLESFDAALVRSAIPNYFLARLASDHVKVILTGEGADELFGGYEYLSGIRDAQRFQRELWTITTDLHNTNLQRTDRMTMAHSIEGRVPFLDKEMLRLALNLPAELKFHGNGVPEKALLRRAFAGIIPQAVLQRPKQKFSAGAGSINLLERYANDHISNAELAQARQHHPEARLRSKEELLYYRIFGEQFGSRLTIEQVGRTRSVTTSELQ